MQLHNRARPSSVPRSTTSSARFRAGECSPMAVSPPCVAGLIIPAWWVALCEGPQRRSPLPPRRQRLRPPRPALPRPSLPPNLRRHPPHSLRQGPPKRLLVGDRIIAEPIVTLEPVPVSLPPPSAGAIPPRWGKE